jgi:hypothetical protein
MRIPDTILKQIEKESAKQCCGSGMLFPDPYFIHPGLRIQQKQQKRKGKNRGCGSEIRKNLSRIRISNSVAEQNKKLVKFLLSLVISSLLKNPGTNYIDSKRHSYPKVDQLLKLYGGIRKTVITKCPIFFVTKNILQGQYHPWLTRQ